MNPVTSLEMPVTSLEIIARLRALAASGELRQLDLQFARLLADLGGTPELVLAAALTSFELGRGHVCLPLPPERWLDLPPEASSPLLAGLLPPQQWSAQFASSPLVGQDCDEGEPHWPLRLWGGRLYLTRYHDYEQQVAARLQQLASQRSQPDIQAALAQLFARDYGQLAKVLLKERGAPDFSAQRFLAKYLDLVVTAGVDWPAIDALLATATGAEELQRLDAWVPERYCRNDQKLAVATAAGSAFTVISGGPGTGKTTTVTKLLALLVEQGLAQGRAPLIRLVAPTGKAAARLSESIGNALAGLSLPEVTRQAIPTTASTLHRLLGSIPGRNEFRHHAANPLHLDLLVVDEASMVDLPLMARLLAALPAHARLVLLGDKDQLASVEAGAVLGDICSFVAEGMSPTQAAWLSSQSGHELAGSAQASALADTLCLLRKSWRFDAHSGIGQLAQTCNRGEAARLPGLWEKGYGDIQFHPWQPALQSGAQSVYDSMIMEVVAGYRPYLQAARQRQERSQIFALFNGFQLLCALRAGPFGVEGLNLRIEHALAQAGLINRSKESEWYPGRPVMVVQNDHGVALYNGDLGLCLPDDEGQLRVWFEQADGTLRALLPSRLPPHETVYAMTIHKSQGSEFAAVVMALPERFSPILTRELIYTGITRAKSALTLYAHEALLAQAIRRKTERYSGLAERLAQGDE